MPEDVVGSEKENRGRTRAPGTYRVNRLLGICTSSMAVAGTMLIFAVMILVNADIFLRAAANAPLIGVNEIVSQSIVAIAFLQLPHTLRVGRLTRAELLMTMLQKRAPGVALSSDVLFHLIGAVVFAVLAAASWSPWLEALRQGYYVGAAGGFSFPVWPAKLVIFVGSCFIVSQFLALAIIKLLRAKSTPKDHI